MSDLTFQRRDGETVRFRHLQTATLRPLVCTLIVFLTVIIVVGTAVSVLVLYSSEPEKKALEYDDSDLFKPNESEEKVAREKGICVGNPPRSPMPCIMWDWNENDYRIGVIIRYFCHTTQDPRPNTFPVLRVECSTRNHWLIIDDKLATCDCPVESRVKVKSNATT